MESTSKEIALELLFLEGSGERDRMRLLRIPRRSSSADVENMDAALWAMAQMDSDIRHGFWVLGREGQYTQLSMISKGQSVRAGKGLIC